MVHVYRWFFENSHRIHIASCFVYSTIDVNTWNTIAHIALSSHARRDNNAYKNKRSFYKNGSSYDNFHNGCFSFIFNKFY